ncbi:hypothetical protein EDB92DRAFT_1893219 [Lactarius akahatsu]|uniref:Uncharacterized protein n=1 Tax=Lactarius akahatsu TaxID=416441 RepID=A0AAD4L9D7_9AGAM|nr:hypothetical protein EDB92DRAFT_1893219 [Lactarius akahatsu]
MRVIRTVFTMFGWVADFGWRMLVIVVVTLESIIPNCKSDPEVVGVHSGSDAGHIGSDERPRKKSARNVVFVP